MSPAPVREPIGAALATTAAPVSVSFEFFPPSDAAAAEQLWQSIERLAPLRPRFMSVTYGADGSTRERTHGVVTRVLRETAVTPAPHLTCIGATRETVLQIARGYWDAGIRHIVALRGDPPHGAAGFRPHPGGFHYAADLVRGLKRIGDFDISVAAYPETHPEAPSAGADLEHLKAKLDAGASRAITQFFFDPEVFLRFRDRCLASGIDKQLVPGILPITRLPQMLRFAERCGATVPAWLTQRLEGLEADPDTRRLIAAAVAIEQVECLARHGVHDFHFYTLNRADLTFAICHALGVRPATPAAAQAAPQ